MTGQVAEMARDLQVHSKQTPAFTLDLKTTRAEVRIDFNYRYDFLEYCEGGKKKARLAGPLVAGPRLMAQTNAFVARDVCADSQHHAR